MQLAVIRKHHQAIVAAEQRRHRPEGELRRAIAVLQAQVEQWRQAGGTEADCPLTPLREAYERRLRGEKAEGPSPGQAGAPEAPVAVEELSLQAEGPSESESNVQGGTRRSRKRGGE